MLVVNKPNEISNSMFISGTSTYCPGLFLAGKPEKNCGNPKDQQSIPEKEKFRKRANKGQAPGKSQRVEQSIGQPPSFCPAREEQDCFSGL